MPGGSPRKPDSIFWPPSCINYSLWQWRRQLVSGTVSGCVIASVSHGDWLLFPFFFFFFFSGSDGGSAVRAGTAAAAGSGSLGKNPAEPGRERRRGSVQLIPPVDSLFTGAQWRLLGLLGAVRGVQSELRQRHHHEKQALHHPEVRLSAYQGPSPCSPLFWWLELEDQPRRTSKECSETH